MFVGLVSSFFAWLPLGLLTPVLAVVGVFFLSITLKILSTIFDFLFKFLDIFT